MSFSYCPECGNKQTVQKLNNTDYECSTCGWRFWNNAKCGSTIIFLRQDGMFLAAKRGREPYKGKFDAPGGFIDYGESPEAAAIREAREETGLIIKNPILLTAYPFDYMPRNHPPVWNIDLIFVVTEWEGDPKPGDDVAELYWKPLNFMKSDDFISSYPGLIAKLQAFQN